MLLPRLLPAMLLVAILLFAPLPLGEAADRWPALTREAENAAHVFIFAGLAWLVLRELRQRLPQLGGFVYPATFAIVTGFGLGTEIVQAQVGRDSAWIDLANDACGTVAALLLVASVQARASPGRATPPALLLLACGVFAVGMLPLGRTLAAYGYRALQAPTLWRADSRLLRPFSTWYLGERPTLELSEVALNTPGYNALKLDIRNLADQPLQMEVRLQGMQRQFLDAVLLRTNIQLQPGETRTLRMRREQILAGIRDDAMITRATGKVILVQDTRTDRAQFTVDELRWVR